MEYSRNNMEEMSQGNAGEEFKEVLRVRITYLPFPQLTVWNNVFLCHVYILCGEMSVSVFAGLTVISLLPYC
jgi:hypothetical protein